MRRMVEEISNEGFPPQDNQVPPNDSQGEEVRVNPLILVDGEITEAFLSFT